MRVRWSEFSPIQTSGQRRVSVRERHAPKNGAGEKACSVHSTRFSSRRQVLVNIKISNIRLRAGRDKGLAESHRFSFNDGSITLVFGQRHPGKLLLGLHQISDGCRRDLGAHDARHDTKEPIFQILVSVSAATSDNAQDEFASISNLDHDIAPGADRDINVENPTHAPFVLCSLCTNPDHVHVLFDGHLLDVVDTRWRFGSLGPECARDVVLGRAIPFPPPAKGAAMARQGIPAFRTRT